MRHTNLHRLWAVLLLLVVLCLPGFWWQPHQEKIVRANYQSLMAPVFFVPGSSATQNRFNALVKELNRESPTTHSLLRVEVMTNGRLEYSGNLKQGDERPFIVVGFQNHRDGPVNVRKQAVWFATAFQALEKTYHFTHFSAMGHSNGGLVLTLFMEHDLAKTKTKIDRLMTIATPFNLEEQDAAVDTDLFKELSGDRTNLPRNATVYSIAGSKTFASDGIVPFDSVNRGKYIFQDQVKHFTQITVTGANANHADLPENQQIVALIRQDLLS
ncbi:alpha/beta hydrolase [Levilactobacillus tongjiangensis]|uniref:Alpha/beta hydrolase n=1 Tax=Levilactobacillus tongjiangensis TaxID=2486023 RepID=A0ABW1SNQ5_9LACO|nr:alpha/beta hydrolase [Levilactobacillus tongjiangensis]